MAWVWLAIGTVLEVIWVLTIKATEGYTKLWISVLSTSIVAVNLYVLSQAFKNLPTATAYAIWTGASAIGVCVCGAIFYGESLTTIKLVCITLVVVGIVGLKSATTN